jgi:hypothetical protein
MIDQVSRRRFLLESLGALLVISTVRLVRAERMMRASGAAIDGWLAAVEALSAGAKQGQVTPRVWRRRVQRLTRHVALPDVLQLIDFDNVAAALEAVGGPEPQRLLAIGAVPGSNGLAFSAILARIREGFAIVPHGHHNMVSMHVVLTGAVHLRQYDRIGDDGTQLVIRPMADRICRPGDTTAISTDRGNVHWFRGLTDCFALVIGVYDLDRTAAPAARDYVDPLAGQRQPDGSLRVPRLTEDEAMRRYLNY